jgi:hypothetical protein
VQILTGGGVAVAEIAFPVIRSPVSDVTGRMVRSLHRQNQLTVSYSATGPANAKASV